MAREALTALYHMTSGWRIKSRWLDGGSICRWHGIECVDEEVTSIDLGGNGMFGYLPTQLASLSMLRVLNIDESRLSGTLPSELGSLQKLETILLASNPKLSGTLPHLVSAKITTLDVSNSRLSGTLSAGFFHSSSRHLQRLQLDHTRLSGTVAPSLGSCTKALQYLFVHASPALSGTLPSELGRLGGRLLATSFASTRISGTLPSELGRLTQLRSLWLVNASLSGTLPSQLGRMGSLRELEIHRNRLSGTLPDALGRSALWRADAMIGRVSGRSRTGAGAGSTGRPWDGRSHRGGRGSRGGRGGRGASLAPLSASLRRCVLTASQGPHQPRHSMRPVDEVAADTNRFSCPLPPTLPSPCVAHLNCTTSLARANDWRSASRAPKQRGRGRG